MTQTLNDLELNRCAKVKSIRARDAVLVKKLLAMGVLKESGITVVKKAFFGDPIEVKIKGYYLTLRKNEASAIEVEVIK